MVTSQTALAVEGVEPGVEVVIAGNARVVEPPAAAARKAAGHAGPILGVQ